MFDTLIAPRQLAAMLGEAGLVVIDCRFDLGRPDWGAEQYACNRIPGSRYAHLDRDLSSPITASTGRHPLPRPEALAERCAQWGIDANSQVVVYDQGGGGIAARLWWLLRWLGHRQVALLDGGLALWQAQQLPMEAGPPSDTDHRGRFEGRADVRMVVDTAQIELAVKDGAFVSRGMLVDARAGDRFAGRNETLDPVAGHVPGAVNHPFTDNLRAGQFLPAGELRGQFQRLLAGRSVADLVCMCGSGVTACHNLLALEVAGLGGARLYAGSWSEWIRDPGRPVAHPAAEDNSP